MKHIAKTAEPETFTQWKADNPLACFKDMHATPDGRNAKNHLRQSLVVEQHHLCCYCESLITDGDFHIEHFRPKAPDKFPHLQLEYSNLHACCHKEPTGSTDECCGHKKKDEFHPDLISPLETDCSTHFTYTADGKIIAADERGRLTIDMLNLNSAQLCDSRKSLIDFFLAIDEDEIDHEIALHLDTGSPVFGEFFTTIQYLAQTGTL